MAAATYLGGPVTGKLCFPSPDLSGNELTFSIDFPYIGNAERLRSIPRFVPLFGTDEK
jgi:hypothetical protein